VSKNVALFVDVANLYYSARGQDVDVDYVALLKSATKGRDLIRAYAYSGLDPENENQRKFIDFLNKNGYKVLTKDIRKFGDGRVKANLDIELVVDLFRLADRMDIAVIVSGDGDFAPAIRALQDKGVRCEVISFRPNTSSDLIAVADEFIDVMKIAGIGRGSKEAKAQRGMSAPEMPAKEVVPEFGFREASPGVAAAALAALREGKSDGDGRSAGRSSTGRGRGRGRGKAADAAEAAAEAPEVETMTVEADSPGEDGEQRKRRRRRGGRGRGRRGRGHAEEAGAGGTPAESGEIGWVELDDLSQLAELEGVDLGSDALETEREYTFEEADADTLAELGISDASAVEAPAEDEAEKKPARRRSTRTAAPKADAEAPAEAETEKKPARRRSTRKTAESVEGGTDAAPAEEKPKRTTRSRASSSASGPRKSSARTAANAGETAEAKKPARRRPAKKQEASSAGEAAAAEGSGEETEGIWQRFRSARGRSRSS
jgi:uncharacterized LabA/DUF88 family protein